MVMVVFDGLSVTPDIQTMIEKYYVGNILLTSRNIRGIYNQHLFSIGKADLWSQTVSRLPASLKNCKELLKRLGFITRL